MEDKSVIIVGAGPGGLTSAMMLARRGFKVTVFEKKSQVGGRNAAIKLGDYTFDTGPTFLMMKFILDEVFEESGRKSSDYLDFVNLEPMYRLYIKDQQLDISSNHDRMRDEIRRKIPRSLPGFEKVLTNEAERFKRLLPCLQKPYGRIADMFSHNLRHALPVLQLSKTVGEVAESYFPDEAGRLAFIFQTKYLGMSAWECPAAFMIVPFVEHNFGIYHVQGGLSEISEAMARVAGEHGAEINLSTPVKEIIVKNRKAAGVKLENGEEVSADAVVINADFANAMTTLFEPGVLRKYTKQKLEKKKYSCSTFMMYLGVDKLLPELSHHNIIFADDYKASLREIFETGEITKNVSCYVRNSSITDPRVAPQGHSNIYILVPVANLQLGRHDWQRVISKLREKIFKIIEKRTGVSDLSSHVVEEKILHPNNWENDYDVFYGAIFNLAHNLFQMLYFRPHNRFEEVDNIYLAGGGTHPGSGLPTIYESGRIAANLITEDFS